VWNYFILNLRSQKTPFCYEAQNEHYYYITNFIKKQLKTTSKKQKFKKYRVFFEKHLPKANK